MIKLGKWITKHRVIILIVAVVLLIPSVLGMIATRINYDMLNTCPTLWKPYRVRTFC